VVEMLLHSSEDETRLLPALPTAWSEGAVQGLRTRGGYEISFEWHDRRPVRVSLLPRRDGPTTLVFDGQRREIILKTGERLDVEW
jgi:alpha-L-fucosidase 2